MVSAKMAPLTSVDTDGERDQERSTGESMKAEGSPWCVGKPKGSSQLSTTYSVPWWLQGPFAGT